MRGKELVAVKTVKGKKYLTMLCEVIMISEQNIFQILAVLSSSVDVERLTKEMSTMLLLEHTNVMSLRGVCLADKRRKKAQSSSQS